MYVLIVLALAPFILLGTVVSLFWWEERILPSPERSQAAAYATSGLQGAGFPELVHNLTSEPSDQGQAEQAEPSAAVRAGGNDRLLSPRPVGSPQGRLAHGRPGAVRDRNADHPVLRPRPRGPSRIGHRDQP